MRKCLGSVAEEPFIGVGVDQEATRSITRRVLEPWQTAGGHAEDEDGGGEVAHGQEGKQERSQDEDLIGDKIIILLRLGFQGCWLAVLGNKMLNKLNDRQKQNNNNKKM